MAITITITSTILYYSKLNHSNEVKHLVILQFLPSSANLQLSQNWAELVLLSLDPATRPTRASLSNASRGLKFGLHIKIGLARQKKKGQTIFGVKSGTEKLGQK